MFGLDSITDIASRLVTAFATGGMSEVWNMALDLGKQVISNVLTDQNVELPRAVETALNAYEQGFSARDLIP